ncbi:TonB-dependent receptor [Parahaliea aestuarii]|uniref:TonB-dependent receptor n=1 Tax=Parahaliea aestuarii TaxID=1852021 RepID=A0A5C9A511_9GAMM|nr:TonB-dependent receptor [Parahaliea aestuarii]TXS95072.1 TonB-dependent receptor [Parahaliea aestuarii]
MNVNRRKTPKLSTHSTWLKSLSGGALLALAGTPALAAQLEEVIVTAQKRAQSLQDVPVAVTAIDGEKIGDLGIKRLDDLTMYTPTVMVTEGTGEDQIFIRGVGSGVNKGFEQSVGMFIDGLYYGRGRSSKAGFLDLERVEILKGPQGILFGKNTIAGAMNITTRNPGLEAEGFVNATYEIETNEKTVEAAYGGPLSDTFGARLAVRASELDGWIDNTFTGDEMQEQEDLVARLSTVWNPTDTLEVIGKLTYSDLQIGEKPAELVRCSPTLAQTVAGVDDCRFNGKTTIFSEDSDGGPGSEDFEAFSAGVTVNWDVGEHQITSITGYTDHDDDFYLDVDYTHLDTLGSNRDEKYENFSQELRLTSPLGQTFDYIAGVYYEDNKLEVWNNFNLSDAGISRTTFTTQEGESFAAFGQVTWNISDLLRLTVGGRYSKDEKSVDMEQYFSALKTTDRLPIPSLGALGNAFVINDERTDNDFSPAVILEWTPTIDHLVYAKYSQGFKAGGFDLGLATGDLDQLQFEPEEVDALELGSKSQLLDGAMTLNVSIFRNEYSDLQVSTFDGVANFNVGNAAESVSQGVDVEIVWALTDELTSSLAFSYLDATYDSFPGAQCNFQQTQATPTGQLCVNDLSGEDLQFAPEYSGHFNLTWEKPISSDYLLTLATDVVFSDEFFVANDLDPTLLQDSFYKFDLRAALENLSAGWEIALVGRNLNDETTFHWGNDVPLSPGSFFRHNDIGRTVAIQGRLYF